MPMRLSFGSLLIILFFSVALSGQNDISTTILNQETARFEAMMHRDTVQLQNMLSDDIVYIHSNGLTESKADHIRSISSGKIEYHSMVRESAQVRRYAKMAIVNGIIHVRGIISGTPFDVRMRYTALYQKQHKLWRLLNWQSTRL